MTLLRRLISRTLHEKGIGKHFAITLSTNIILIILGVLTSTLTARFLGPEGRGQLAQIQLWTLFLANLGHLAIPTALVFFTSRSPQKSGEFLTSAWMILVPVGFLWVAAGYFGLPLLLRRQPPDVVQHAQMFLLLLPIAYFCDVGRAFTGLKQFFHWSLVRLYRPMLYAVVLLLLGLAGKASPITITQGYLATAVFLPFLVLIFIKRLDIRLAQPTTNSIRALLSYGLRSSFGAAPSQVNANLGQMMIALWLTDTDLGLYVIAVAWSMITSGVFEAIGSVVFPYVAGAQNDQAQHIMLALSVRLSVLLVIGLASGILLLTPLALPILFGESFSSAVPLAMLLVIASGFLQLRVVLADGINGLGHPEVVAYAEMASLALTAMILLLSLRMIGTYGAALAAVASYATGATILLVYVVRQTGCSLRSILIMQSEDVQSLKDRAKVLLMNE